MNWIKFAETIKQDISGQSVVSVELRYTLDDASQQLAKELKAMKHKLLIAKAEEKKRQRELVRLAAEVEGLEKASKILQNYRGRHDFAPA
jgi:hypothetical protein